MYKIIVDYYSDGWKFQDEEYKTIDEAVQEAITRIYGNPFLVVEIVKWEAIEIN